MEEEEDEDNDDNNNIDNDNEEEDKEMDIWININIDSDQIPKTLTLVVTPFKEIVPTIISFEAVLKALENLEQGWKRLLCQVP